MLQTVQMCEKSIDLPPYIDRTAGTCGELTLSISNFSWKVPLPSSSGTISLQASWKGANQDDHSRIAVGDLQKSCRVQYQLYGPWKATIKYLTGPSLDLSLYDDEMNMSIAKCRVDTRFLCSNSNSRSICKLKDKDLDTVATTLVEIGIINDIETTTANTIPTNPKEEVVSDASFISNLSGKDDHNDVAEGNADTTRDRKMEAQLGGLIKWGESLLDLFKTNDSIDTTKRVVAPPPPLKSAMRARVAPKKPLISRKQPLHKETAHEIIQQQRTYDLYNELEASKAIRIFIRISHAMLRLSQPSRVSSVAISSRNYKIGGSPSVSVPGRGDVLGIKLETPIIRSTARGGSESQKKLRVAIEFNKEILTRVTPQFLEFTRTGNLIFEISPQRKDGKPEFIGIARMPMYPLFLFLQKKIENGSFSHSFSYPFVIYNDEHRIDNPLLGCDSGCLHVSLGVAFAGELSHRISEYFAAASTIQRSFRAYRFRKFVAKIASTPVGEEKEDSAAQSELGAHVFSISFVGISGMASVPSGRHTQLKFQLPTSILESNGTVKIMEGKRVTVMSQTTGDSPSFNAVISHKIAVDDSIINGNVDESVLNSLCCRIRILRAKEISMVGIGECKWWISQFIKFIRSGVGKLGLLSLPIECSMLGEAEERTTDSLVIALHYKKYIEGLPSKKHTSGPFQREGGVIPGEGSEDGDEGSENGANELAAPVNSYFHEVETQTVAEDVAEDINIERGDRDEDRDDLACSESPEGVAKSFGNIDEAATPPSFVSEVEAMESASKFHVTVERAINISMNPKNGIDDTILFFISYRLLPEQNAALSARSEYTEYRRGDWLAVTEKKEGSPVFNYNNSLHATFEGRLHLQLWAANQIATFPVGSCTVALLCLAKGMEEINGWYHLTKEGREVGQLKVRLRVSSATIQSQNVFEQPYAARRVMERENDSKMLLKSNLKEMDGVISTLPKFSHISKSPKIVRSVVRHELPHPYDVDFSSKERIDTESVTGEVEALFEYLNKKYSRIPLNSGSPHNTDVYRNVER